MFKCFYILGFVLSFSLNSYCQWVTQNTNTNSHLYGVDFIDSLRGVSVGHFGTIIKTIDGGNTWYDIPSPETNLFWKVKFITDSIGWISGGAGTLLCTKDQGETWVSQNAGGIIVDINNIYFITDSIGWALGAYGTLLYTVNQGDIWLNVSLNQEDEYSSMFFVNDSIGFLAGRGVLYKTINRGNTWEDISFINEYIIDIVFVDEEVGWLCGETGLLYKTEDGGETWFAQNSTTDEWLHDLYFFNSNEGWAVGRNGKIIYTINGGDTWFSSTNPVVDTPHMTSLDFVNENHGWACGGYGTIIKYSHDSTLSVLDYTVQDISVYPNPVSLQTTITLPEHSKVKQVYVYDIHGRDLGNGYIEKKTNQTYEFIRQGLKSGIYILVFEGESSVKTVKLCVE